MPSTKHLAYIFLSACIAFGLSPVRAQDADSGVLSPADSTALAQGLAVAEAYASHLDRYFNGGETADADFSGSFMALFNGSQKIIADYALATWRLESAEYLFEAGQVFGEDRPAITTEIDRKGADIRHFPNDQFHIAVVPVTNRFSKYFDQSQGAIVADTLEKYLTLEIRIGGAENARINRTFEREPAVVWSTSLALTEDKSGNGPDASVVEKETKKEKTPREPKAAKAPKQTKEPKEPKEPKAPRERKDLDRDAYLLAGIAVGSDFGMANTETLDGPFGIRDHSFQQTSFALTYFHPLNDKGLFVGAGIGMSLGKLTLEYENTSYAFEEEDLLNPIEGTQFAAAGNVANYERNVSVQGLRETIEFTDINLRLGVGQDLLSGSDDLLMVGAGIMFGLGQSQTSQVRAVTNYHGRFTEVNGLPIDLTLGLNEDIPEYGFEERSTEREFDIETGLHYSAFFHAMYARSFGDRFYIGIQVEAQVPLSDWKEGTGDTQNLFRTFDGVHGSIANQVSSMKRPVFFGGGLVIGIKF